MRKGGEIDRESKNVKKKSAGTNGQKEGARGVWKHICVSVISMSR